MPRSLTPLFLMALPLALAACGARLGGEAEKQSAAQTVSLERPNTPSARAVQVSWTAARASFCAFGMDRNKLRADYLAYERAQGATPEQMAQLERLYDVTYQTFYAKVREVPNYCTRKRIDEIRPDINRHLRGDYTPSQRKPPKVAQEEEVKLPEKPEGIETGLEEDDNPFRKQK